MNCIARNCGECLPRTPSTAPLRALAVMGALILSTFGCVSSEANRDNDAARERDVEVFKAVIQNAFCADGANYHVVSDRPAPLERLRLPKDWPAEIRNRAVEQAAERQQWPQMVICAGARMVGASMLDATFARDKTIPPSWQTFKETFPGAAGLVRISAPVFGGDGSVAFVYVDQTCDVLCGTGLTFELRKRNGGWEVVHTQTIWIS